MILIKSVQKVNPLDRTAEKKYYVQAVSTGEVDLERLAYLVSNQSSVNEGDCYNVILSLVHNIADELKQGKIVRLDRLGAFQIGVQSQGIEAEEEVGGHLVNKTRLNFRPSKRMKNMLASVDFRLT